MKCFNIFQFPAFFRSGSEGVEQGGDEAKCPRTAYDYIKKEWRKLRDSTGSLDKIWSKFPKVGREQVRNWGEKFDARMDSVLKSIPAKVAPAGKSFVKGANKIVNKLESSFNKGKDLLALYLLKSIPVNCFCSTLAK